MKQDRLITAMLAEGAIRIHAISAANMVQQAQDIHSLSRVCTAALGRQMMATAMMAAELKKEGQSLTTILSGDGPAGNLVCTGRYNALVKGYVTHPEVELPPNKLGKLDVAGAVGTKGKLTVIKDLFMKEPYTGTSQLVSGEIAEDFAQYFTVSEQQPSLVYLGVRVRPDTGAVLSAGGLIAQTMPGFPTEHLEPAIGQLETKAAAIGTLAERLELAPLSDVLETLFYDMGYTYLGEIEPAYLCDCSRERIEQALIALGREELLDMIRENNGAELTCQFCNARYRFTGDQLRKLLEEAGGNAQEDSSE